MSVPANGMALGPLPTLPPEVMLKIFEGVVEDGTFEGWQMLKALATEVGMAPWGHWLKRILFGNFALYITGGGEVATAYQEMFRLLNDRSVCLSQSITELAVSGEVDEFFNELAASKVSDIVREAGRSNANRDSILQALS